MTLAAGIDEVTVNFTPGSLTLLSILLAFIMFGIALDTTPRDFRVVARHPRPFVLAIAAQLLILPAITFVLTLILPVTPSMALGMLLVACCPPGNISQILTHRAAGNVALSVSMTAVSNVIYIVALPLSISFWGSIHPDAGDLLTDVRLDPMRMLVEIALIIGVPFALGLGLRSAYPRFADRVQPTVKWVGLLALVGFVVAALAGNWEAFVSHLGIILVVVAIHDSAALGIGWSTAAIGGLGTGERKAMTFEVGIRNAGLGLGLVMTFFDGLGGMAVVAGWWGVWDVLAGLVLATVWGRHTLKRTGSAKGDAAVANPVAP
ncbi:bile acid:sodium symporter family protein [Gordonia sp. NPDC003585]|uniref:bile acid:sodium symporter family protein n=1 Tax=Gordonia sp. NPDC003585 TaxID=3154275 RepID=UPI0033B18211